MQGSRRTVFIATVVALLAAAATLGIAAFHRRADDRRARYEQLMVIEASADRLSALEWEASSRRRVPLAVQAEVTARLDAMRGQLLALQDDGGAAATRALAAYRTLRPGLEQEFALMRSRDFASVETVDDVVDPAFDDLRDELRSAAVLNHELAGRSDRVSWIGTVAVMILLVVGVTALLGLLDRAGRRRLRDGHLHRLAF
ncbi:MAG TPA: hypothetical protein VI300_28900, partial [Solirubrobacter sp.]